ncbi:MAG: glycosyltransferase family 4 protein [Acidobacteriota bacterium]
MLTIAGWNFPVHSQTFVYQEMSSLAAAGFDLHMAYSGRGAGWELDDAFRGLDQAKVWLASAPAVARRELENWRRRDPDRLAEVIVDLASASGLEPDQVQNHCDFGRGLLFARLAEDLGAHYLHSYFFYEGSLACFVAARLLDLPRGMTCYADHQLDDYALKAVRLQLAEASLVVATSQRVRDELQALAPEIDAGRLLVKPNAVDGRRFSPVPRRPPSGSRPLRLLSVCRLEPKKGLPTLLEAVAQLPFPWRLRLVGGRDGGAPDHAAELQRQAEHLGIVQQVDFLGAQPTTGVYRELTEADVFVAPYAATTSGDKDGIPTSLMEAMATALPVVATREGSIAELVTHDHDGLLVPARDPRALAAALTLLQSDPDRRHRLAEAAAETIRRGFDVRVCEPLFHRRLHALLSGTGALDHYRQGEAIEEPADGKE